MTNKIFAGIGSIFVAFGIVMMVSFIMAYPIMRGINYLFTPYTLNALFGMPQIDVYKAWVLTAICSLIFKSSSSKS